MKSRFKEIISENSLCVLCTCKDNIPYASLMLYISNDSCTKIYVLTRKTGAKYLNILGNAHVSLLIDTRNGKNSKPDLIEAITVCAEASVVEDKDTSDLLISRFIEKHEGLQALVSNGDVCVVEISIRSVLLLDGVDKSQYFSLTGSEDNTAQRANG